MSFNPVSTPIVVILLVAGLIVGLSMASIDLLNPWTAGANAARIAAETNHQQTIYTLHEQQKQAELNAYKEQTAIALDKARQKSASDLAFEQRMSTIKIQASEMLTQLGLILMAVTSALLALGLSAIPFGLAVRIAHSAPNQTANQPQTACQAAPVPAPAPAQASQPTVQDRWDDPDYRKWRKALAKQREQQNNLLKLNQDEPTALNLTPMQSAPPRHDQCGPRHYADLPLVGDD
jgi:hypothetical protein